MHKKAYNQRSYVAQHRLLEEETRSTMKGQNDKNIIRKKAATEFGECSSECNTVYGDYYRQCKPLPKGQKMTF